MGKTVGNHSGRKTRNNCVQVLLPWREGEQPMHAPPSSSFFLFLCVFVSFFNFSFVCFSINSSIESMSMNRQEMGLK